MDSDVTHLSQIFKLVWVVGLLTLHTCTLSGSYCTSWPEWKCFLCLPHTHTHTHTHTVALWMLHVCMQRVKASYAILQWKCLFFRIASWYRRSWVPTVWLSYWVTYFPSGQHAVAIREYLLFPQSVDTKPRWMLRFVRLLSTGEIWNVLQTDVKRCTVALKSHLILQPCKVSYHSYSRRTL